MAYEADLIDTDIDAEETIHDGEDSNLIRLLADDKHPPKYYSDSWKNSTSLSIRSRTIVMDPRGCLTALKGSSISKCASAK